MQNALFSQKLLEWYDIHARVLPWRILPADHLKGISPDPYKIWLSEVMLQQTTVASVKSYFETFSTLWPTVVDLANEKDEVILGEWAGLGYYARARNLIKCARLIRDRFNGRFPDTYDELLALPGIGPYTAAAIACIAFDRSETVVDGNVERVTSRIFCVQNELPSAKKELASFAAQLTPIQRCGDYAQAMMDLGATICTPKSPSCALCPVQEFCEAYKTDTPARFPLKTPKKTKPTRYGYIYVAKTKNNEWILEKRPEKGLLGGMLGWPTTPWADNSEHRFPFANNDNQKWQDIGQIKHTFTHFHLILNVYTLEDVELENATYHVAPIDGFDPKTLPTLMRKALQQVTKAN